MFNGQGQWIPQGSQAPGTPSSQQQQNNAQDAQQQRRPQQQGNSGKPNVTPQQIIQSLMRLDPQQRNAIIVKNPQLQLFLQQYEQHRKAALQQQAQKQHQQGQDMQYQQHNQQQQLQQQQQQQQKQPQQAQQSRQGQQRNQQPSQSQFNSPFQSAMQPQMLARQRQQILARQSVDSQRIPPSQQTQGQQASQAYSGRSGVGSNAKSPLSTPSARGSISGVVPGNGSQGPSGSQIPLGSQGGAMSGVQIPLMAPRDDSRGPVNMTRPSETPTAATPLAPAVPPARRLEDTHYWSKSLEKQGQPIPSSVRVYEQIVDRDLRFDERMQRDQRRPFDADVAERMVRDLKFYQKIRDSRLKAINMRPELNRVADRLWGEGYAGYGNGFTNGRTEIVLPQHRKKATEAPDIYISPEKMEEQALAPEDLVPIRLEFDQDRDGFQLSDTFLWNLNEKTISLDSFADILMADYKFPSDRVEECKEKIIDSIEEQIGDYHPMVYFPEDSKMSDLRFPVSLDITIANNQLTDRFDWDITNPDNDPEEFAKVLCADMSLPGEFVTAVSHSIREQCQTYIRSLYLIGYRFDGSAVTGDELKEFVKPSLDRHSLVRPRYLLSDYTTSLQELSYDQVEKLKKERERESRRKKRGQTRIGRRGGLVLPDLHDLPKTFRTPVPNSVLPGGVDLGHPSDSYLEYPMSVEIPQRQLKALEDYSKEQAKMREQERLEQLEIQKHREAEIQLGRELVHGARMRMMQPGGLKVNVSWKNDHNKVFTVTVKFK
ncbi:DEKNAAC103468 [Brettanomyces naardenensis]|uniref:DEKNAAC103468 n=1 Tax=Brettanomyces naardenensis TaxID=13370 RepID=A0A448YNU1_BRENA|nr:DEKNAAC103468 [Brettanomyces naardenensis]